MSAPTWYETECRCDACTRAYADEQPVAGGASSRLHDGPCDIERVEPGWNVQADSGEVFVSDAEIAALRLAANDGDIQAARLIAERYSAAYADGFSAGVELGESRAAVDAAATVAPAAPDLAPGVEFALEVLRAEAGRFAMMPRGQQVSLDIGLLRGAARQRGVVLAS